MSDEEKTKDEETIEVDSTIGRIDAVYSDEYPKEPHPEFKKAAVRYGLTVKGK